MMRSWMLISLLFLSFLAYEAQGIRLRKGTPPDRQHKIHKILQGKRGNVGVEDVIVCKGKHCSGRIRRLLITRPISSTTTIAKNDKTVENKAHSKSNGSSTSEKIARKEENMSVNSSSINGQQQPASETYPDILDITGMDYSQARRKPPIHN